MRRTRLKRFLVLAAAVAVAAMSGVVSAGELAQQASRDAGVTVRAKPIELSPAAKLWTFEISIDTHSQELSEDLARVATLNGADGAQQAPMAWDGDPPGGHHRKGVLRFKPIVPAPDAVELRIQRPGEPTPRRFRWQLK